MKTESQTLIKNYKIDKIFDSSNASLLKKSCLPNKIPYLLFFIALGPQTIYSRMIFILVKKEISKKRDKKHKLFWPITYRYFRWKFKF